MLPPVSLILSPHLFNVVGVNVCLLHCLRVAFLNYLLISTHLLTASIVVVLLINFLLSYTNYHSYLLFFCAYLIHPFIISPFSLSSRPLPDLCAVFPSILSFFPPSLTLCLSFLSSSPFPSFVYLLYLFSLSFLIFFPSPLHLFPLIDSFIHFLCYFLSLSLNDSSIMPIGTLHIIFPFLPFSQAPS